MINRASPVEQSKEWLKSVRSVELNVPLYIALCNLISVIGWDRRKWVERSLFRIASVPFTELALVCDNGSTSCSQPVRAGFFGFSLLTADAVLYSSFC